MAKPVVFISHIHEDEVSANTLELVLKKALLGALDFFNSSNRRSIAPGDPWREQIVESLKRSATVIVLASPESVASPWVNFETGGAWVAGTRVIPCCVKGMTPASLPAPLGHLQAISLDSAEGLRLLVARLAETAKLDEPVDFDFEQGTRTIVSSWETSARSVDNTAFLAWFTKVSRRPEKYKGESAVGYFRVKHLYATDRQQTGQFRDEAMKPGDTLSFSLEVEGAGRTWTSHCFAAGPVADFLESVDDGQLLRGTVKALGQMKVYETVVDFGDEDRGISYPAAWRVMNVAEA
jgi:hypothetical protein